jgi:hypothetical protein
MQLVGAAIHDEHCFSSYAPRKKKPHVNDEGRSRSHGGDICRIRSVFA